jgi:hypothetical protein
MVEIPHAEQGPVYRASLSFTGIERLSLPAGSSPPFFLTKLKGGSQSRQTWKSPPFQDDFTPLVSHDAVFFTLSQTDKVSAALEQN